MSRDFSAIAQLRCLLQLDTTDVVNSVTSTAAPADVVSYRWRPCDRQAACWNRGRISKRSADLDRTLLLPPLLLLLLLVLLVVVPGGNGIATTLTEKLNGAAVPPGARKNARQMVASCSPTVRRTHRVVKWRQGIYGHDTIAILSVWQMYWVKWRRFIVLFK